MEVKIISGYGENTFQMDDADTMSLLNNAMRFHNKIKAIGGVKDNTDTKAEKEEEINESITAQEFVKKCRKSLTAGMTACLVLDGRKNQRKPKSRRIWNILTDIKGSCISNVINVEKKKDSVQKKKSSPINVNVAKKRNW